MERLVPSAVGGLGISTNHSDVPSAAEAGTLAGESAPSAAGTAASAPSAAVVAMTRRRRAQKARISVSSPLRSDLLHGQQCGNPSPMHAGASLRESARKVKLRAR